ncbi:uncharacterized protein PAC_18073 [Phialocephala subalpina]|uniref:Uncharacterized protein n=1 Tax=Phialocephala subalpina TaxID=576137 RepID=A0A1L7XSZ5_9HELO|nr:uncharacterized protein PAC_18073 [Phialocephala subalpina]
METSPQNLMESPSIDLPAVRNPSEPPSQILACMAMSTSNAQSHKGKTAFNLCGLPKDVIVNLMSVLLAEGEFPDLAISTSLGLTCRSFYDILKSLHNKPIGFIENPEKIFVPELDNLVRVVRKFLGEQYREASGYWGDPLNLAQDRLEGRIYCYEMLVDTQKRHPFPTKIPYPLGKGDRWYEEMLEFVDSWELDSCSQAAVYHWRKDVAPYINAQVGAEMVMAAWQEWIVMVDL